MSYDHYAPPQANLGTEPTDKATGAAPALWIPSTTANICLLFPLALGAWLQRRNWEAMGRPDEARKSLRWVIADVIFLLVWLLPLGHLPALRAFLTLFALVMLITWYYSSAKPQMRYVQQTYGKHYPRRGWLKPLGAGIAIDAVLMMLGSLTT